MKIGSIGLGIMGSRMAANLQKAGHSLVVYNRTREKAEQLMARGAAWAGSPAKLAAQVEIIFTMLAHPEAVKEAALGEDGFLSSLAPGRLWVDCSTVNPSFSMEMAAQARVLGIRFLDAPVTGSKEPAALGKLIFWVGGEPADVEACRPLFQCMGSRIVHGGRQGMGGFAKNGNEPIAWHNNGRVCRRAGSGEVSWPAS
jgi:3-hydroxyisobutyrate dehydrogenase-like beta-hydroxyacid dehydrogenase